MPLILGTNSIKDTGYNVDNSLRFNSGSTDSLSRTPSSASNRRTYTISMWFKRSSLTSDNGYSALFTASSGDSGIFLNNDGTLEWYEASGQLDTSRVFRDVSAWYHVVVAFDTTQGTASNRVKLYINGVQETAFDTETYPNENAEGLINNTGKHAIGVRATSTNMAYGGYMAEVVLIDGTALDPTSFGEFDSDSGIWKPKDVSGLTFGTNGFYLDFESSGSLGADVSGNGNNFTVNNLTAIDQSTDTCTNNFATLNPLTKSSATFSEGNLKQGGAGASAVATFGVSSGKWYFEQKILGGNNEAHLGFALENSSIFKDNVTGSTVRGSGYVSLYSFDGKIYNEGSATSSFGTFSANDIISFALDVDAGDIFLYQNGTLLNSGSAVVSGKTGKTWFPFGNFDAGNVTGIEHNFGGTQTFTISSGNSDGNGYGNFEYSVPSGYYALNTKNLAEYG